MSWYYYGARPVLLLLAALLTAYLCDCALAPLHGTGYQSHEPSSECFAALIVLLMPASISYPIVISAVIVAVLVKEAFGGEGHYPFHPAAVGVVVAGISWPQDVFSYPIPGTQLPLFGSVNTTRRGHERHSAGWRSAQCQHDEPADRQRLRRHRHQRCAGRDGLRAVPACARAHQAFCRYSVLYLCHRPAVVLPESERAADLQPAVGIYPPALLSGKYVVLSGTALFTGLFLVQSRSRCRTAA